MIAKSYISKVYFKTFISPAKQATKNVHITSHMMENKTCYILKSICIWKLNCSYDKLTDDIVIQMFALMAIT